MERPNRFNDKYKQLSFTSTSKRVAINDVSASDKKSAALVGFICDEGVRRNQGRVGAANGPNALREGLASLPWTFEDDQQIIDVGNIVCLNHALEEAQRELGEVVATVLQKHIMCGARWRA